MTTSPPPLDLKKKVAESLEVVLKCSEDGSLLPLQDTTAGRAIESLTFNLWESTVNLYKNAVKKYVHTSIKPDGKTLLTDMDDETRAGYGNGGSICFGFVFEIL